MSSKLNYCPVCGHCQNIFDNNRNITCPNCFSKVEFLESQYDEEYYEDKAMDKYGTLMKISDILMEEEVKYNPLFNPEKAKMTTVADRHREIFLNNIDSDNTPKCPICSSTHIRKISSIKRVTHAYTFGLFSKTARSQFECENCKHKW